MTDIDWTKGLLIAAVALVVIYLIVRPKDE